MKKYLSLILAITILSLSACNTAVVESEGSSEVSFTEIILITEPINDFGVDWVTEEEISTFIDKHLPLNSENGKVPLQGINPEISSMTLDDQYLARYCEPSLTMGYNFSEREDEQFRLANFAWYMQKYYIDINELTETEFILSAFPSAIVDEIAKVFFGIENLNHPIKGGVYGGEKSVYLFGNATDFGAPTDLEVEKIEVNADDSVTIYYGLIDLNVSDEQLNSNPEPSLYYYVTVMDNDDGQTWRYIEGKEYFPREEKQSEFDETTTPEKSASNS